ncbi:hypothetical protein N7481_008289 [Penicillium waksmanii]|uniref:uncharacterized protein n=1 Tax=Penicillium waksmanii TaxID=69791 RepID=UPI0025489C50|nr:uncharacterized protein N7481_008289 [Penicillium waksmanii]KAJ5980991.1 hypothetical protein N7481_008289 [Penicillium waksmanii]
MPLRSHTKSRKGCDQCRTRKVKCDERGPPCSNCTARELSCTYLKVAAARASQSQSQSQPETPAPLPHVKAVSRENSRTRLNGTRNEVVDSPFQKSELAILELMHKFSTETFRSLCVSAAELEVWQTTVPNLALKHDFLMNGILSLAAMHIASSREPPEALAYLDIGLQRYNRSLKPFRDAIDSLTEQNCDAVFAHSIIMTAIGIASPRLTGIRDESSSMTESMVVVFELLQGVKKILQVGVGQSWINLELFSRGAFWKDTSTQLDEDTHGALAQIDALNDEVMTGIYESQHQINREIIAHLRHCYAKFALEPEPAPALAWLAAVRKEFVDGLRCRQPFSLLILMYWGVLLGELDGRRWWARDAGRALVSELLGALRPGDPRWQPALMWAQQRMSL